MAGIGATRDRTLDSARFPAPPVGSVLTFERDGRRSSFTWDSNAGGHALVRLYLFTGWVLVAGRSGS